MKKFSLTAFTVLLFTLSASQISAQVKKTDLSKKAKQTNKLVKSAELYAKQIEIFVEKEKKPHLIIADISDYNESEKPVWKKFVSESEFEKAREQEEAYTIAYIWKKNTKPVQVNFTYSSPSGDWAEYFYQTYREDGSLAKAVRELRTFMGDIIVNQTYIFDEKGKLLKETKTFRDLNTNKIIKPTENYQDVEAGEIYLNINKLPFTKML